MTTPIHGGKDGDGIVRQGHSEQRTRNTEKDRGCGE